MNGLATGPAHPAPGIGVQRLESLAVAMVHRYRVEVPDTPQGPDAPLLDGRMHLTELQPGMHLRLVDVRDRFGLTSHAELPEGLKVAMVIGGTARVRYARDTLSLGPSSTSIGLLAALNRATPFTRFGRAGGHERTLILTLSSEWLARHGHARHLTDTGPDPRLTRWHPSPGLLTLAHQCFGTKTLAGEGSARQLQLHGFALAMVGEALAAEEPPSSRTPALHAADPRLDRLMAMIDGGQAHQTSQAELARRLGMSLSCLQRRFRARQGQSLGRFLRRQRLAAAHAALSRQGLSIDAAADLAGYSSAPNFATAFKRAFGITPSECRAADNTGPAAVEADSPL
ncbi:helix-turn-helix domain-containing protein [Halomonas sp. THAF12]|uniref:helix-turn-helix domain-containing protein n=1 Tax=Halomonas sp. B23F22_10 TaxID=3459515 RepID=UPI00373E91C5